MPVLVAAGSSPSSASSSSSCCCAGTRARTSARRCITIAVSVIVADQVIAHFPDGPGTVQVGGGNAVSHDLARLDRTPRRPAGRGIEYSLARLVMLALGVSVGIGLWLWLYRTKTGMVIRAGVDDRQMTSALGINIQRTFAIAFVVGSALAAFGAAVGGSQGERRAGPGRPVAAELTRRRDRRRHGIAARRGRGRRCCTRLVLTFSAAYLPITGDDCCSQYSIVLTFVLIALVLAFRPQGLFGRAG